MEDMAQHGRTIHKDVDISWAACDAYHKSDHRNEEEFHASGAGRLLSHTSMRMQRVDYPWAGCIPDIAIVLVAVNRRFRVVVKLT